MFLSAIADFRAAILRHFPELSGAQFRLHTRGFHSVAVDADDRLIFKFPRGEEAAQALRREAALLATLQPRLGMPVPRLALFEEPVLFSCHAKLPGNHLLAAGYAGLPEQARATLAEDLAGFYAELHALDHGLMQQAGALPVGAWLPPEDILRQAWPVLPPALRALAQGTLAEWTALPADPLGLTYGFFDGHGWNMAFDHERQRLNGVYDFADSGFGPLHQEFIYTSFISLDLTARIITAYERLARQALDRRRIHLLTGVFWLSELGGFADQPEYLAIALRSLEDWAAAEAPSRPRRRNPPALFPC